MVVVTPEPVVEFLTWNVKRGGREPTPLEWVAVVVAACVVIWFAIMAIAEFVEWILNKFFYISEWELDNIDDMVWLEAHPLCCRCNQDGLFVLAEYAIQKNGRIQESACRKHFLQPGFRYHVTTMEVGNK